MNCIICKTKHEIEYQDKHGYVHSVYDAVLCDSTGNYGSTVFDPLFGIEKLQFIVCDKCLVERADLFYVFDCHKSIALRNNKRTFKEMTEQKENSPELSKQEKPSQK